MNNCTRDRGWQQHREKERERGDKHTQSTIVDDNWRNDRSDRPRLGGTGRSDTRRRSKELKHLDMRSRSRDKQTRDRRSPRSPSARSGYESDSSKDDTVGHFRGGPGSAIAGRYMIEREMGVGTFGRVFLCEDTEYRRAVALKVVRKVKKYTESARIEADVLIDVRIKMREVGNNSCVYLYDHFKFQGHYCMVMEPLGRSLYDVIKDNDYTGFGIAAVREFARQLLEALDFLQRMNLIHTDLKPENVLLTTNTFRAESKNGKPYRIPINTSIKLIDFGGATYDDERKGSIINTRQYRGPEVTLEMGWSFPSDIWSAACIIAELYTGELLFATHDNMEHLALMEVCLGRFPMHMTRSEEGRRYFYSDGSLRWPDTLDRDSRRHVRKMKTLRELFSDSLDNGLVELLEGMLTLDPARRLTARDALRQCFVRIDRRSSHTSRSHSERSENSAIDRVPQRCDSRDTYDTRTHAPQEWYNHSRR